MHRSKRKNIACALAALCLMACFGLVCIAPSQSRLIAPVAWTGTLKGAQQQEEPGIQCDLLVNSDISQTVLLKKREQYTIPLEIYGAPDTPIEVTVTPKDPKILRCTPNAEPEQGLIPEEGYAIISVEMAVLQNSSTEEYTTAEVTVKSGQETLHTTFQIPLVEQGDEAALESQPFSIDQEGYSELFPIFIQCPQRTTIRLLKDNAFPAKTRYRIGEEWFLLYDAGMITLPKGTAQLDLSLTGLREQITVCASACSVVLEYRDLSAFTPDHEPIIVGQEGMVFPIWYRFGNITPEITVKYLTTNSQGTVVWQDTDQTYCVESDGNLKFVGENAPPGTYRIRIGWIMDEQTYYAETTVFVQQNIVS